MIVHAGSVVGEGARLQDGCVVGKPLALGLHSSSDAAAGATAVVGAGTTVGAGAVLVAGARVGNSVAAFAIERLGVRCFQLPTTLLGRRPDHGAPGGGPISAEMLGSMTSLKRSITRFDVLLTLAGMAFALFFGIIVVVMMTVILDVAIRLISIRARRWT